MPVDAEEHRALLATFATGCTVVTMVDDEPHGLTANAFSSVSLQPPLILVCVDHETTSYQLLEGGNVEGFCVNVLSKSQRDLREFFANMIELEYDPFETRVRDDLDTYAPVFEGNLAYLNCSVYDTHSAGDHTIYVGQVERGEVFDGDADPLTFYEGKWGTIIADD